MSDFIDFDEALELKHLGFNEHVFCTYRKGGEFNFEDDGPNRNTDIDGWLSGSGICSAPLYSQVFRWFRDNFNLACYVICYELVQEDGHSYSFEIPIEDCYNNEHYNTYEEAELALLQQLIKIIKHRKNEKV